MDRELAPEYKGNGYYRGYDRDAFMLRKYGITAQGYAELLFLQGGVCKICKGPGKAYGRLVVDHDHETGVVRGLLCNTCNAGLGQFKDSVELLEAALAYLKEAQ